MPRTVTVTSQFTCNGVPIRGIVRFTPSRLWVIEGKTAWASLCPTHVLDGQGGFSAEVTPTDSDPVPWYYRVCTPAGTFKVKIPWSEQGYRLKELIDDHHPGPRAPHR
jgi:hypothetical protein